MKIQKQQAMRNVLYGLSPLCLAAIYFYGWRFLAMAVIVLAVGLVSEWLMSKRYGLKITESLFVSCMLFALSMPPEMPFWMAGLGMAFGIVFGKMVFGGFGKNVFNPAITARAFVYVSFGVPMTGRFLPTAVSTSGWFPAGLANWLPQADTIASATPLVTKDAALFDVFLGNVPGCFGESSALLILLGGAFIIWKKAANWKIVAGSIGSFLLLQTIFWATGTAQATDPLYALLSGSFLFGAFFMITDPVSAGQSTDIGKWLYGMLFGVLTVLIRLFASWPEGVTFAILLANMFGPLVDHVAKTQKQKKKAKAAAAKGGAA